jgi:hypothetical protein
MVEPLEWRVSDTFRATADDGRRVDVACKMGLANGPFQPKGQVQGRLWFLSTSDLTLADCTLVARCYVCEGNLPFDRTDGPETCPFQTLRCAAGQPVEVAFAVDLPEGCPSYAAKYGFKVEWQIKLLHEGGYPALSAPIWVEPGSQTSCAVRWERPARASAWHWGMLFWAFVVAMGFRLFPVFRDSLSRESLDMITVVGSGLFCLVAFLAPEALYRFYTRIARALWLPIRAVLSLATRKLLCLEPADAAKGVVPGVHEVIDVHSSLPVLRASIIGASYWDAGVTLGGGVRNPAPEKARSFAVPIHIEGKRRFFLAPLVSEVRETWRAGGRTDFSHRLAVELPADVPFSYVKGAEGIYWEIVLRGAWYGIPLRARIPLRVLPPRSAPGSSTV